MSENSQLDVIQEQEENQFEIIALNINSRSDSDESDPRNKATKIYTDRNSNAMKQKAKFDISLFSKARKRP